MVCQICREKSGYYPLCKKHNTLRDTGKVKKCDSCSKWIDTGKPLCKDCYFEDKNKKSVDRHEKISERKFQTEFKEDEVKIVGNRMLRNAIEDSIAEAKNSVYILSPYIEQFGHIFHDLDDLVNKNGTVKVIFKELNHGKKYELAIVNLLKMGADVRNESNLHAKLVIVDEKIVIVSSANLLARSFLNNHELGVYTTNKDQVKDAVEFFKMIHVKANEVT